MAIRAARPLPDWDAPPPQFRAMSPRIARDFGTEPRAEDRAAQRRQRTRPSKLSTCARLREAVVHGLEHRWSPQQIVAHFVHDLPDDPEMPVSHETIYQALFVHGRGALLATLTRRGARVFAAAARRVVCRKQGSNTQLPHDQHEHRENRDTQEGRLNWQRFFRPWARISVELATAFSNYFDTYRGCPARCRN